MTIIINAFAEVCARCLRHRMNSSSSEFYPTNHITDNSDDDNDSGTTRIDAVKELAEVGYSYQSLLFLYHFAIIAYRLFIILGIINFYYYYH